MFKRLTMSSACAIVLLCISTTAAAASIMPVITIVIAKDTVRPDWLPLPLPPKFINKRAAGYGRPTPVILPMDTEAIIQNAIINRIGQKPRHK